MTHLDVGKHVADEYVLLLLALLLGTQPEVQTHDQRGHETALLHVPQPLGEVAQHGLEEQRETHPLVVRVVLGRLGAGTGVGPDARVRGARAHLPVERVRHGERGRDPAERVHRPGRKPFHDALDGVADVLRGRHHDRARQQRGHGERDVHAEHGAVGGHRLPLDELLEAAQ